MITENKYRTLIGIIIILVATNLSMGISFIYHKQQDKKLLDKTTETTIGIPVQQRTRFFREQLNLSADQMDKFRELNRNYNRSANDIALELENLRIAMVEEMGKTTPSQASLDEIAEKIGRLHSQLKKITMAYYLSMKNECNDEQKIKLNEIFKSALGQNEAVKLPGRQGRYGWNKNRSETNQ